MIWVAIAANIIILLASFLKNAQGDERDSRIKKTLSNNREVGLENSWICSYCYSLLAIRTTRSYDYDLLSADASRRGNGIMSTIL
jgi:hypothetical protein